MPELRLRIRLAQQMAPPLAHLQAQPCAWLSAEQQRRVHLRIGGGTRGAQPSAMPHLAKKGVLPQAGMWGASNCAEAVRPSRAVCVAQLDSVSHAPAVHSCQLCKHLQTAHIGRIARWASTNDRQRTYQHDRRLLQLSQQTLSSSSSGSMLRHGLVSEWISGAAWLTQACDNLLDFLRVLRLCPTIRLPHHLLASQSKPCHVLRQAAAPR